MKTLVFAVLNGFLFACFAEAVDGLFAAAAVFGDPSAAACARSGAVPGPRTAIAVTPISDVTIRLLMRTLLDCRLRLAGRRPAVNSLYDKTRRTGKKRPSLA